MKEGGGWGKNNKNPMVKYHTMKSIQLLGVALLILGIIILSGYGLYLFATAEGVPLVITVAIVVIVLGFIILLLSLVRERLTDIKRERHETEK